MTDRTKIVLIYVGVALICALILTVAVLVAVIKSAQRTDTGEVVTGYGKEDAGVMATLTEDLKVTKQDGEEVSIFDLKDKVWVAAQFYASCPICAARNGEQLLKIYEEFKDEPDFRMVCLSIDPEGDSLKHLSALEEALGVDGEKWWFVKGEGEDYMRYMEDQMGYLSVREQTDPLLAQAQGKWVHDMSLELYDGLDLVAKVTLEGNDEVAEVMRERFKAAVRIALKKDD